MASRSLVGHRHQRAGVEHRTAYDKEERPRGSSAETKRVGSLRRYDSEVVGVTDRSSGLLDEPVGLGSSLAGRSLLSLCRPGGLPDEASAPSGKRAPGAVAALGCRGPLHGIGRGASACFNDAEGYLVTASHSAIKATEAEFVDLEASEFSTAVNPSMVKRLVSELATER